MIAGLQRLFGLVMPCLVPSWAFFQEIGESPRILFQAEGGPWVPAYVWPKRLSTITRARRLFWNPEWNAHLYQTALAERLLAEQDDAIARTLCNHLLRTQKGLSTSRIAVRIDLVSRTGCETIYQSPPLSNGA